MSRSKSFLFCLLLTIATQLACRPCAATQLPPECAGIQLAYFERIEGQGLFGLLTPKARASIVEKAVADNVAKIADIAAWKAAGRHWNWPKVSYEEAKKTMSSDALARHQMEIEYTKSQLQQFLLFRFRLPELCTHARKRGYRQLTLACVSDTAEQGSSGDMLAECFLSMAPGSQPSISSLKRHQWGKAATVHEYTGTVNRHDAIDNERYRGELYFDLVREVVNGTAFNERSEQQMRDARLGSAREGLSAEGNEKVVQARDAKSVAGANRPAQQNENLATAVSAW